MLTHYKTCRKLASGAWNIKNIEKDQSGSTKVYAELYTLICDICQKISQRAKYLFGDSDPFARAPTVNIKETDDDFNKKMSTALLNNLSPCQFDRWSLTRTLRRTQLSGDADPLAEHSLQQRRACSARDQQRRTRANLVNLTTLRVIEEVHARRGS